MKKSLLVALAATSCLLGSTSSMALTPVTLGSSALVSYSYIAGTNVVLDFLFNTPQGTAIDLDLGPNGSGLFQYNTVTTGSDVGFHFGNGVIQQVYFGPLQSQPDGANLTVLSIEYSAVTAGTASGSRTFTATVPEPATWAMMLVGLGMIGYAARRRQTKVTYA